ncbi:hypothetical protein F4810DRAFT_671070 [Camillea tinctor]|nr:hypothetical protein F4810DRAFT_671070 [Camillea tinctor]
MSDASDREDHAVSSSDHEQDDHDGEEYSSDPSESGSESGSEATNPLLDMEAVESDGASHDETADELDEFDEDEAETYFFPQFCRLPIELRERIWEYFDPNLASKGRVFEVSLIHSPMELWEGPCLMQQIEPSKAMLAVHRESRALALKRYPDTFYIRGERSMIPFHGAQDVILLYGRFDRESLRAILSPGFLAHVKNLAVDFSDDDQFPPQVVPYDEVEEQCHVRLYTCIEAATMPARDLQPFVSDSTRKFYLQTREEEPGIGEDIEKIYCWDPAPMGDDYDGHRPDPRCMVRFTYTEGLHRYDKIKSAMSIEGPWEDKWQAEPEESESDTDAESVPSDYELDDFVVDSGSDEGEDSGSDDNDDDVDEEDDEDMEGGHRLDDNVSSFNGFSPLQDEDGDGDVRNGRDLPAAHFSSLEPESPRSIDSEDSDVPGSPEQPIRGGRKKNRRIISSDDGPGSELGNHSLNDEELELEVRPARENRRKRRIASSDDEDEDEEDGAEDKDEEEPVKKTRPNKRARVIMSDSEDEDKEDKDENDNSDSATEEEDDDEEEDSDSDKEPVKARPVSLLDRLRRFKSDNPISPTRSDDAESVVSEDSNVPDDDDDGDEDGMGTGEVGMYAELDAEEDYGEEEDEEGEC